MNRIEKDVAHHNAVAHEYDRVVVEPRTAANDVLFSVFQSRVDQCGLGRMLDLGCGTGHMCIRYGGRFANVTAVDHSTGMLEQARRSCESRGIRSASFVQSDVVNYVRSCAETFSLITCVGCLHHLSSDDQRAVVAGIARLLDGPRALAIIADPIVISGRNPPKVIQEWNRAASSTWGPYVQPPPVEPDEAPIEEEFLLRAVADAGLRIAKTSRSWEVYSRSTAPGMVERARIWWLVRRHGRDGNVFAMALNRV